LHFIVTKICAPGWGVRLERGCLRGVPPERRNFAVIGSYRPSVKTVQIGTDMLLIQALITLFRFINIDDPERP